MIRTYSQSFKHSDLVFEMTKESAQIYNMAIKLHKEGTDFKEIGKIIDRDFKNKYLLSESRQASYQQYCKDFTSFAKALSVYSKNPEKFCGQPKPPHHERFMRTVYFKKDAVRYKGDYILLSTKKPNEPIRIEWDKNLPIPEYVTITFDRFSGWKINLTVDAEKPNKIPETNTKIMAIDLGVKRIATTFDGEKVTTYSGKEFLALGKQRNELLAKAQSKYANTGQESRRRKYVKRGYRRKVKKIKNKEKDILHKYSRTIVNDAIANGVKKIVIGDCSNIHKNTNLGRKNNQKIQQNPEQKLKEYVCYKFDSAGGITEVIPERRTSKTCPKCKHLHKHSPKGRTFKCKGNKCDYVYDRDGIGAMNIHCLEVSFDHDEWLNVIGRMTLPLGVKYHPNLPCKIWRTKSELNRSCQGKETTML